MKEVRKRGHQIEVGDKECKLTDFDVFKEETLEKLKNGKYNDLADMVYIFQLTYDEIVNLLDLKYLPTKKIGYYLKLNVYQISDINNTLKNILPDNVEIMLL